MEFWRPGAPPPRSLVREFENTNEEFVLNGIDRLPGKSIVEFRESLPITAQKLEFLWAVANCSVTIIVGETGCGKSTQLPQYLVESKWASEGLRVGVVMSKQLAAITIATRVAYEMGTRVGEKVGYKVRFDDKTDNGAFTSIKYMTDGVLLREVLSDPLLTSYSVILLDDCHDRHINSDLLCGLLKKIMKRRSELRVVIASATADATVYCKFFKKQKPANEVKDSIPPQRALRWTTSSSPSDDGPRVKRSKVAQSDSNKRSGMNDPCTLRVKHRLYPVSIHYLKDPCSNYLLQAIQTVLDITSDPTKCYRGDILIFLTGKNEITFVVETLKNRNEKNQKGRTHVLPLYAGLPVRSQLEVFKPTPRGCIKVIVSTNIAETSVTIDNIAYVIDCSFAKYPATKDISIGANYLTVAPISKASARQRAGRAGRNMPGVCYRLCTKVDFDRLPNHNIPEILRCDLSSVVLLLKCFGISNILTFDFPTPPSVAAFETALENLYGLEAIDMHGELTDRYGVKMAELPLTPHFAKLLVVASEANYSCSMECAVITAMYTVDSCWLPATGRRTQQLLDCCRMSLGAIEGDFIAAFNIFRQWQFHSVEDQNWTKRHMLNNSKLLRIEKVYHQLSKSLKHMNVPLVSCGDKCNNILKAICAAFFMNVCEKQVDKYKICRRSASSNEFEAFCRINSSSVLYSIQPQWTVCSEILSTAEGTEMRWVSVIDPRWLHEVAPHYFEAWKIGPTDNI